MSARESRRAWVQELRTVARACAVERWARACAVEKFWAWLRKTLRAKDLADFRAGRPLLARTAMQARVRAVCKSRKATVVARNCVRGLTRVCKEVLKKKGARTRG